MDRIDKVDLLTMFAVGLALLALVLVNAVPGRLPGLTRPAPTLPGEVQQGAAISLGRFSVVEGWQLAAKPFTGEFEIQRLAVQNNGKVGRVAYLTVRVLDGEAEVASISCQTERIRPGQQKDADCLQIDGGTYTTEWDKIIVERTL